jgi:probable phosphoglycerate mutase
MLIRTDLYFIRHGEGGANISNRILDRCDGSGLTPRGIRQVQQLQQRLRTTSEIQADVIVSSTFWRALETAHLLASIWQLSVQPDDGLQELRWGADNIDRADFARFYGAFDIRDDLARQRSPNGESWHQFSQRATSAIDCICQLYKGQTVLLVTHGGVIRALLFLVFRHDLSRADWGRSQLDYTSITHWCHEQTDSGARWSLMRWNDAAHLHLVAQGATTSPISL